jgi:acetate---CoA ligase (ADP-forming) subunit alpha
VNISQDLKPLFYPDSVALIGASGNPVKVGNRILKVLKKTVKNLYPVHPLDKEVLGLKVINRIEDLPDNISLAIVTISANSAVEAVRSCAKKGIKVIVIVSGGFSEIGGEGSILEDQLRSIHKEYGTRMLGPNSLGIFLPETGLDTIFVEHGDTALSGGGGIAFITQSGSVGTEALGLASNAGYGMRAFVGLGNKVDLTETHFLEYFSIDKKTNCLAFYSESLDDGKIFLEKAREASKKKAVVILKAGRTEAGQSAVSSHTGKLAGSDNVVNGAFRQYGIQRAYDEEEICDASKTLSMMNIPKGNRVAVISAAGGYGVMCTYYIEQKDSRIKLHLAEFTKETTERLNVINLPFASTHNPVDITASADDNIYVETLNAVLKDPGVDIVICLTFFTIPAVTEDLVKRISEKALESDKPVITFAQYGPYTNKYLKEFYDRGLVGFSSVYRTVRAARFLVERADILKTFGEDDEH